jgi:UDP-glucuronate 4-epimerase
VRFLVTGTAGFIGFHVAKLLTAAGHSVCGIDGMTTYYDVALKRRRHAMLLQSPHFAAHELMLENMAELARVYEQFAPDVIIHLAAQAGVRYSLENPRAYVDSNLIGTFNVLELARAEAPKHLLLASTSSVYGANTDMPFGETDRTDFPVSLYAATKRANELMAHAYSHLYRLPTTGLRFFTVYGPWGRPDMAPMLFASAIAEGRPIRLFNEGRHSRDFTYVDDIVEGVIRASDRPATPDPGWDPANPVPATSNAPFRLYNIGNGAPVDLADFIAALETALGRKAVRELLPLQPGDVPDTWASSARLARAVNWRPATPVGDGVARFVAWFELWRAMEAQAAADPRP